MRPAALRTLAVEEAVGVHGRGEEALQRARDGEVADVAPGLAPRGHRAHARYQERRYRLRLLAQDVEDLRAASTASSCQIVREYDTRRLVLASASLHTEVHPDHYQAIDYRW